jgi:hypothetical protein
VSLLLQAVSQLDTVQAIVIHDQDVTLPVRHVGLL